MEGWYLGNDCSKWFTTTMLLKQNFGNWKFNLFIRKQSFLASHTHTIWPIATICLMCGRFDMITDREASPVHIGKITRHVFVTLIGCRSIQLCPEAFGLCPFYNTPWNIKNVLVLDQHELQISFIST